MNRILALIKLYQYMYGQFFGRYYYKAMYSGAFLWKPYISLSIPTIKYYILNDKNYKFKKEVGITVKVGKQVTSYLAKKLLSTCSTGSIDYYLCLFVQTQFRLGSYIHACINKTHSLASVQDLIPTLATITISNTN